MVKAMKEVKASEGKNWIKLLLDYFINSSLPVAIEDNKVTIQGKLVHYEVSEGGSFKLLIKTEDGRVLVLKGWHSIKRI